MKVSIGAFDKVSNSVPVTFTHDSVVHQRPVNAVLDAQGKYDRLATKARVDQVAAGVEVKIVAGVLTNAPAEIETSTPDQ